MTDFRQDPKCEISYLEMYKSNKNTRKGGSVRSLEVTLCVCVCFFFHIVSVSVCRASTVMAVKFATCLSVNAGRNPKRKNRTASPRYDERLTASTPFCLGFLRGTLFQRGHGD